MKGQPPVIDILNDALKHELGAVNQYWLHYRLMANWGFTRIAAKERAESIEEMQHADKLIDRIIFLEGHPNLQHVALASEILGNSYVLKICMNALRSVDKTGGLDPYLLKAKPDVLSPKALRLKRAIAKKTAQKAA